MAKNKMSGWAIAILVLTIISAVLLVMGIIAFAVALPEVKAVAEQAAHDKGLVGQDFDLAVAVALAAVIAAFVVSIVFEVFQVIGGFLFSLKGRWGVFCIVVSILSAATNTWELISAISNRSGALTIVTSVIALLVSAFLVVACFMHRAENRRA
ncbi:MAG: hypothetical protein IJS37_05465 [Bacilli bacterium]|nr:hypothetical protein [Bacilli bacterium]